MPYYAPSAVAADFSLGRSNYTQPPATAVDIDFATDGGAGTNYSRVPGVIADFKTPWNPRPATKGSTIDALFQMAEARGLRRSANAANASNTPEPEIALVYDNADKRDREGSVNWDNSIQARENNLRITSEQAAEKDISAMRSNWESASKILEPFIDAPFLIRTPSKDSAISSRYFSSAVFAPIWYKHENKPEPFYARIKGKAYLEFFDRKNIRRPSVYEIGAPWENNPIQPKDGFLNIPAKNAIATDVLNDSLWELGRPVDVTRAVVSFAYDGEIDDDDGGNPGGATTFKIPTLRFYIVANSAQIVRVSDGRDVPASAVTLSINSDGYSWGMSATLAGNDARALIEGIDGEPTEVDVTINGESWRVLIDAWRIAGSYGRDNITVTGRSRSAYLAAPYALPRDYIESSDLLAVQLAEQELPNGWSIDWSVDDWIVDAGAWRYNRLTPIQAIAKIATAGGGYIQPDRTLDKIYVRPLYPAAPWNWINETPDFQIPRDILLQRNSSKSPGAGVNGVFVHGGAEGGILAKVIRTGTSGNVLAGTIVDPLITDSNPAKNRGIVALADSGRQSIETHELPLSSEYGGLIEPGALIASGAILDGAFATFWRGMVRGVTVNASATRASNGGTALKVRQALQIERQYDED